MSTEFVRAPTYQGCLSRFGGVGFSRIPNRLDRRRGRLFEQTIVLVQMDLERALRQQLLFDRLEKQTNHCRQLEREEAFLAEIRREREQKPARSSPAPRPGRRTWSALHQCYLVPA